MSQTRKGFDLTGEKVVIIGGSSGIGLETARLSIQLGAELVLGGRSEDKLAKAKKELESENVETYTVNNRDEASLMEFFKNIGTFDHLFTPGASYTRGPITADMETAMSCFEGKFWPQFMAVKYCIPYIRKTGSIVLMSGAAGQRPLEDCSTYSACNAGIECMAKAIALELRPLRVNAVAPGTIRTPFVWEGKDQEAREEMYRSYAKECYLEKVGEPIDIAEAVNYLFCNKYSTATTLYPDGGFTLR